MERGRGDEMTRESLSGKVFILGICELPISKQTAQVCSEIHSLLRQ